MSKKQTFSTTNSGIKGCLFWDTLYIHKVSNLYVFFNNNFSIDWFIYELKVANNRICRKIGLQKNPNWW